MVDYILSKSNSHGEVRRLDHHTQHLIYADNENNQDSYNDKHDNDINANNQDTNNAEIIPDKHRMTDIPIPEANSIGYGNFFRNVLSLIFSNHRTNEKLRPGLPPRGSGPEGMFLGNLFVVDQDARQSESIKRVFYR